MPSRILKTRPHARTPARQRRLIVTIDGPAGVGKSTAARLLSRRLGLVYLDTGATYRALAYAALVRGVALNDARRLVRLARSIRVVLKQARAGVPSVYLNGRDISREIRTEAVTDAAAVVAQHPRVRGVLVRLQRELASDEPIVVEGRDTGSVVFPQAAYKFFLTAKTAVRARRRQRELANLQGCCGSLSAIARQLRQRDRLDRTRLVGPLCIPPDAVVVDTSYLQAGEVVKAMLRHLSDIPLNH